VASVKNDRSVLKQNIAGIHEAVATFLGFQNIVGIEQGIIAQQILLSDEEATAMSNATADLFDRLGWNITGGGESNVYIAAAMFAFTLYRIEGRRFAFLMALRNARNITPLASSTAAETGARGTAPRGGMDFSGDIAAQVNTGENPNDGTIRYN